MEGTFYFGDTHLGASSENFDLVRRSFANLQKFCRDQYIEITKAVDLGDTVECWVPDEKHKNPYLDNEVIRTAREMYRHIFFEGRQLNVTAFTGNHQTHILEGEATLDLSIFHSELAVSDFRDFLSKVFADNPDANFEMVRGVKEIEEGVIVHHGDILNTQVLAEMLDSFDGNMTIEDKLKIINGSGDITVAMQRVWQKFRRYLWPMIKKWPKWLPSFVDVSFPPYLLFQKTKSWVREAMHFTKRSLDERWKNPMYDELITQFNLLRELSDDPEKSAIVSGHFHAPSIVSDAEGFNGTVVSLGAWHDVNTNPIAGIRFDTNAKKNFMLAEFEPTLDRWYVRDEKVIRDLA
ncbi:hypothetical protein KKA95_02065 [Patescibacteria group bacterium]|nr:hypothetical protein [Patescibacteria group bacterium]